MSNNLSTAYFAGGCFWGLEYFLQNLPGVIKTRVGFMGGRTASPSYEEVSAHATGHAETLEVIYDESQVSYKELAKIFFEIHDPTQLNRQGPDIGDQYRSEIFYTSDRQAAIATKLMAELRNKGWAVVTLLNKSGVFWSADPPHQKYYAKNGGTPYCHARVERF